MLDNAGTQLGTEMLDTQYANKMTGLPGGLADVIARQLERQMGIGGSGGAGRSPRPPARAGRAAAMPQRRDRAAARSGQADFIRSHQDAARSRRGGRAASRPRSWSPRPRTRSGWGRARSGTPTAAPSHNLFGIKAGPGWKGAVAEITTTEYVDGEAQKVTAKFRAYASYAESFRDYASMMKESPRYAGVVAQVAPASAASAQGFAHGLQRAGYATDPAYADKLPASSTPRCACSRRCGSERSRHPTRLRMSSQRSASARGDGRELRGAADHRQQHRQREHRRLFAPERRARDRRSASQTGSGFFGKGVDVATVTRAHSDFLTREAATTASIAAADAARSDQLQQLETVFPTGEAGLGYAAAQMFNAFVDVANKPQDASARQVVLARIGDLAARFRSACDQLDSIQAGIAPDLRTSVTSINALTPADRRPQPPASPASQGTGHEPNDLLDQRDTAIADLCKFAQVTTIGAADGTVGVFLGGAPEARARRRGDAR